MLIHVWPLTTTWLLLCELVCLVLSISSLFLYNQYNHHLLFFSFLLSCSQTFSSSCQTHSGSGPLHPHLCSGHSSIVSGLPQQPEQISSAAHLGLSSSVDIVCWPLVSGSVCTLFSGGHLFRHLCLGLATCHH